MDSIFVISGDLKVAAGSEESEGFCWVWKKADAICVC